MDGYDLAQVGGEYYTAVREIAGEESPAGGNRRYDSLVVGRIAETQRESLERQ